MNQDIKYLTPQETKILFERIQADQSLHHVRNLAMFKLAKYCALRAGEVGMLLEEDCYIHEGKRVIICRREKGSCTNVLWIIDPDVLAALDNYLSIKPILYPDSTYLFPSQKNHPVSRQMLDYLMKSYCEGTAIPKSKRHFHVLKHTRAVELGNLGMGLKDIQWWLGHKNIHNTLIYAQFTFYQHITLFSEYIKLSRF